MFVYIRVEYRTEDRTTRVKSFDQHFLLRVPIEAPSLRTLTALGLLPTSPGDAPVPHTMAVPLPSRRDSHEQPGPTQNGLAVRCSHEQPGPAGPLGEIQP